jgi:hypothetical protein
MEKVVCISPTTSQVQESEGTSALTVIPGKITDDILGVAVILDHGFTVHLPGDEKPGIILPTWQARLVAYSLLYHAERIEHGLVNVVDA